MNYPGSRHDTKIAAVSELYYPMLSDECTRPIMAIIADSAFVNNTKTTNEGFFADEIQTRLPIPQTLELLLRLTFCYSV